MHRISPHQRVRGYGILPENISGLDRKQRKLLSKVTKQTKSTSVSVADLDAFEPPVGEAARLAAITERVRKLAHEKALAQFNQSLLGLEGSTATLTQQLDFFETLAERGLGAGEDSRQQYLVEARRFQQRSEKVTQPLKQVETFKQQTAERIIDAETEARFSAAAAQADETMARLNHALGQIRSELHKLPPPPPAADRPLSRDELRRIDQNLELLGKLRTVVFFDMFGAPIRPRQVPEELSNLRPVHFGHGAARSATQVSLTAPSERLDNMAQLLDWVDHVAPRVLAHGNKNNGNYYL